MALVSHRKKFIFLKTSKTAGTSIEGYLERYCLPPGEFTPAHSRPETITDAGIIGARPGRRGGNPTFRSHMSARQLKDAVSEEVWETYYKISAVRDPYDKVISAFFFEAKSSGEGLKNSSPEVVKAKFRDFVRNSSLPVDRGKYTIGGKLCVDFVVRYERLLEDLQVLAKRLDLEVTAEALPSYKTGHRPAGFGPESLYDDETAGIVEDVYGFEFEEFGYPLLCEKHPDAFKRRRLPGVLSLWRLKHYARAVARRTLGARG